MATVRTGAAAGVLHRDAGEDLIQAIRRRVLFAPDRVCLDRARLVTEAHREYEGLPQALCRAHCFAHILRNMQMDLTSNPYFAGNTSSAPHAIMLLPEYGIAMGPQVLIENEELRGILDGAVPDEILRYWKDRAFGGTASPGHLAVDLDTVVNVGLRRLIATAAEENFGETDAEARAYREAMMVGMEAVVAWAHRLADEADTVADHLDLSLTELEATRLLLRRVASACRHVPEHPARDLFEGLQAIALIHLATAIEGQGLSISIGLPDRALARFSDEAEESPETATLIAAFLLKVASNSFYGRGSKTQAVTVGGSLANGRDACNGVTRGFLAGWDIARCGDPHLFLRWHPGIDEDLWGMSAVMLSRGRSMPLLVNDVPTIRGFIDSGVHADHAAGYCVIGCNELGIPGLMSKTAMGSVSINYLGLLNEVLLAPGFADRCRGIDDIISAMEVRVRESFQGMTNRRTERMQRLVRDVPTPFTSALMSGCIAAGGDLFQHQHYDLEGQYERGLTNAANALAAIDSLVYGDGGLGLPDLVDQLEADFPDEAFRAMVSSVKAWGNDDQRTDDLALGLLAMRERALREVETQTGSPRHLTCHVVRSLHFLDGRRIGASADGRRAGRPVSDSIGADPGTARLGPTAMLASVSKIDASRFYPGGYNLNLTLGRDSASADKVSTLARSFFESDGQELQINVLDPQTLRDAQARPEDFADLVVRIAGFSAVFVTLSREEQNELITRAEGSL